MILKRRQIRNINKAAKDTAKGIALGAFILVNAVSLSEGFVMVVDNRSNHDFPQSETFLGKARNAFISFSVGGLEATLSGVENTGVNSKNPCQRDYLLSCEMTSGITGNNTEISTQLAYNFIGLPGRFAGGAIAGAIDGAVGLPVLKH